MSLIPNAFIKMDMLKEMNLNSIEDLFSDIPNNVRREDIDIPDGITQQEVEKKLRILSKKNLAFPELLIFGGGGIKPHYVPPAVRSILSRSEFYTSYTPYQPEISQGILQAMFEYQSMIAELTGMEVANCSLYDGATALGEASRMCSRITKRNTIIVPRSISWEKKSVLKNYTKGANIKITEIPYDKESGMINEDALVEFIDKNTACVYIENPNFFGIFEENALKIAEIAHDKNALFAVGIDPLSLGIIKSPGDYDADIVVGEGRSLGNGMNYGGSSLGIFACKREFVRQMPGRIVGMTHDEDGNRAFCMTLQTREQHIRRGKATSNICTNEGVCALAAVAYLSILGSRGLTEIGRINFQKGQLLEKKLVSLPWFKRAFSGTHFNEFVVRSSQDVSYLNKNLLKNKIQGGLNLGDYYPELEKHMLFGVTEMHSDEDMDKLISAIKEVYHV